MAIGAERRWIRFTRWRDASGNLKGEDELTEIEDEIDNILKAELAKTAKGDDTALDPGILSLAAHRLENLIHYRRTNLATISH